MKHAIVIGAGPAGLTAAMELLKQAPAKIRVTLLEADTVVGGISRTVNYKGNRMDLGGHRFFSKSKEANRIWRELLPLSENPDGEGELLLRKRSSRIYFRKRFFDYPITLSAKTLRSLGLFSTLRAGTSYLFAKLHPRKEKSLEDFYVNRFGSVLYQMFFESYTEKLWGRHPSKISADWGSQRVKGISVGEVLKNALSKLGGNKKKQSRETSLIEEFLYPKYGPGQLWEMAAQRIAELGGEILFGTEVIGFRREGERIRSVICRQNGEEMELTGDLFFSSMPLKDLSAGMEGLSQEAKAVAQGLPYRDFVTMGLLLKKEDLKEKNILSDCWIYVQDKKVKLGRIQIFNNWSPYLVKDPEHTVWLGLEYFCGENDGFWSLSEEDCAALALEELKAMGIVSREALALDHHRERVKKAYPAYFDSYENIDTLIAALNEIPNLWCIGRNGQHRYNNMDHSMLTALRAVENALNEAASKSEVWSVNTEKEYHETDQNGR